MTAPAYALALSLLVTAPLLAPGYLLLRDAVSTPRSYMSDAALGLSEAAPRALPQDFAVALASAVLDGGVVVKVLLMAGLWLSGWGAARLATLVMPDAGVAGQCVAATIAIWNPYVAERLLQGHWSLLVGYGCLPWVATAMLRLRTSTDTPWVGVCALVFWMALAGLTPTGLMLAATVALTCVFAPGTGRSRWLCAAVGLGAAVLVALPWLTAAAVADSLSSSQAAGVPAFAARAEPGLGTLASLASLGVSGTLRPYPPRGQRFSPLLRPWCCSASSALGLPVVLRRPVAVPLLVLAAVAVVLPAAMATGPGLAFVETTVRALPGLGVVRDAQKWVALAVPGYALAGAAAVVTLRGRLPAAATAAICCAALVATLPDLAWGVGGKMSAVHYPPGWAAAAAMINEDPQPVAVLPVGSFRRFAWAGDAPVLDPLPRWVRAEVLTSGDLTVAGRTVPGEGDRAREVQQLLLTGADREKLTNAGVGWVVVESEGESTPLALPVAYRDSDLAVYRIGGDHPPASGRGIVLAAHWVWLALLIGAAGVTLWRVFERFSAVVLQPRAKRRR